MGFKIPKARCTAATRAAILVEAPAFKSATWVPQSVVTGDSEVWKHLDTGTLVVETWWAEKRGLAR